MGTALMLVSVIAIRYYRRPLTPFDLDWRRDFVLHRLAVMGMAYACLGMAIIGVSLLVTMFTGLPR